MGARKQQQLLAPGQTAPEFTLPALDGRERSLDEILSAGPVVLAFFKVTCPVCQYTFPFLERLHRSSGVQVVGISQDDAADTREFMSDCGCSFPVLLDTEGLYPASNAYGISHVPSIFLVQADGVVARSFDGWSRGDLEAVASDLGAAPPVYAGESVPAFRPG
jgi:peroxiredoxin